MDKITNLADYIIKRYYELTGEHLDEMKLHKLLYFTQRESFAVLGKPAFEGDFEGWKYGPVSREIRNNFINGEIVVPTMPVSESVQYIASNVIMEYGSLASWKLSELSHRELSWNNSRKGLAQEAITSISPTNCVPSAGVNSTAGAFGQLTHLTLNSLLENS